MASYTSSTINEVLSSDTKLRHLKLRSWSKIVNVLSLRNNWVEVAANVKKPNNKTELMYSTSDISTLAEQSKRGASPAEAFLQHWSTTGMKQPTIEDLISVLIEANLFHAANTISEELLGVSISTPSFHNIETEELLLSDISFSDLKIAKNHKADETNDRTLEMEKDEKNPHKHELSTSCSLAKDMPSSLPSSMQNYSYKYLSEITGNFCDIPVHYNGYKLGEGGYGVVYRAYAQNQWVAIKKLKETVNKQFFNELEILSKYKHENLLPLIGSSNDGPYSCLVYLYMHNGSLQERLACLNNSPSIAWPLRFSIAYGTADGINHLHTFCSPPLIHRDIKSANILLDEYMIPKVGDFGLARMGDASKSTSAFTSNIYGTSVYMAREAFHGEVTIKLDSFSFGVVLLELLTGLPPYDASREEDRDLITYIEAKCSTPKDIIDMLDIKGGHWDKDIALSLYEISKRCLEPYKKDRPKIEEILPQLKALRDKCDG